MTAAGLSEDDSAEHPVGMPSLPTPRRAAPAIAGKPCHWQTAAAQQSSITVNAAAPQLSPRGHGAARQPLYTLPEAASQLPATAPTTREQVYHQGQPRGESTRRLPPSWPLQQPHDASAAQYTSQEAGVEINHRTSAALEHCESDEDSALLPPNFSRFSCGDIATAPRQATPPGECNKIVVSHTFWDSYVPNRAQHLRTPIGC